MRILIKIIGFLSLILFVSPICIAQNKASSNLIKGYWIIENGNNQFHDSDTLIFYKGKNPNKDIPKHHGRRPFIEFEALIKKGDSRVNFELDQFKRAICSEWIYSNSPEIIHSNEWMWGKWKIHNNILEIKSEYHYHWQFKIISIEKIKFEYKSNDYSTIKMIVIKRKFDNFD